MFDIKLLLYSPYVFVSDPIKPWFITLLLGCSWFRLRFLILVLVAGMVSTACHLLSSLAPALIQCSLLLPSSSYRFLSFPCLHFSPCLLSTLPIRPSPLIPCTQHHSLYSLLTCSLYPVSHSKQLQSILSLRYKRSTDYRAYKGKPLCIWAFSKEI